MDLEENAFFIILHNDEIKQKMCYFSQSYIQKIFGNNCSIISKEETIFTICYLKNQTELKYITEFSKLIEEIIDLNYKYLTVVRNNFTNSKKESISYLYDSHLQILNTITINVDDFEEKLRAYFEGNVLEPIDDKVFYFEVIFKKIREIERQIHQTLQLFEGRSQSSEAFI